MMKKVIITGAGGFIGGALSKHLLELGIKVIGIDIDYNKLCQFEQYNDFTPIVADFSKYNELHKIIKEKDIDAFYHFAWAGIFGDAFKNYELQLSNAKYAADAIMQAIKIGCKKFIFAGTYNEYESIDLLNQKNIQPRYTCVYSGSKAASEIICKTLAYNNNIEYNAGLISMVYGENNYSDVLPNIVINQLLKNESPRLIKGDNYYDMIYIDDIVKAFKAIGDKGKNMKSYYIGHRKLKTFRELLTEVGQIVNKDVEMRFGEYIDTNTKDYNSIDLDALYNDTGFECEADFKETILKTAEWIKNNYGE